ncbi:hypothetical protein ANN_00514 [Periplaneta americana]|uniref:Uncharacterized protein n=1 Tax=Periplaneta americana TaxID=6978 RepID=A0ABQ8TU75_PERAM|nr:hypothetical protein ANN_00514 [Periplaneta americana]
MQKNPVLCIVSNCGNFNMDSEAKGNPKPQPGNQPKGGSNPRRTQLQTGGKRLNRLSTPVPKVLSYILRISFYVPEAILTSWFKNGRNMPPVTDNASVINVENKSSMTPMFKDANIFTQIKNLKIVYSKLYDISQLMNAFFAVFILLTFCRIFLAVIAYLYRMLQHFKEDVEDTIDLTIATISIDYIFQFLVQISGVHSGSFSEKVEIITVGEDQCRRFRT